MQGEKPGALSFPDQEAITVASLGAACTDRGGGDAAAVPVVEAQQKLMAYKLLVGRRALERRFPFAVRINGGPPIPCKSNREMIGIKVDYRLKLLLVIGFVPISGLSYAVIGSLCELYL